jgi:oligopeptide/dipeptide ABC transporter ATP-binding protein
MMETAAQGPYLDIRKLTKHFPINKGLFESKLIVHAADQVSLQINRGETLGLVGESGSGKTTVGRCAIRLIEPTSGEIIVNGINIMGLKKKELRALRRKMQMVFQDPADSLNPRFTCRQTLLDALIHAGVPRKERISEAIHLLDLVGLEASDLDKYLHQFSGGQQQRVAIARALAFKPALLILDEPTTSLDVSVKTQVTKLLCDLQAQFNLSYLLISHDLSNVKHISNRVAVMYLGKIIEVGSTRDIFASPMHPYTRVLIDAVLVPDPNKKHKNIELKGEVPKATCPPSGCRFHTRCQSRMEVCDKEEPVFQHLNGRDIACHIYSNSVPGKLSF